MCGFVGIVGLNGVHVDARVIEAMAAAQRHRGPDDEGIYVSDHVGLGFRRLAILDLSTAAHQPMFSRDGQLVLVYNGEIYNYIELRQELEALGHRFDSSGDTEVLLHSYQQWGSDCLHRLNGMWAFLIYDIRRKRIFGSRDRFGKKPLYYYRTRDLIVFGSEIKAILASGYYCGGTNWRKAASFLLHCDLDHSDGSDETLYSGITQVSAGTGFELDLQGYFTERRFWSLDNVSAADGLRITNINDAAESFYHIFEDSLRIRLRSDVPVGVLLSGGLDSTAMLCTTAKILKTGGASNEPLWALSYQDNAYDESLYIEDTVRQVEPRHIRWSANPVALWNELEQFLWHQDEPVHSMSALVTFELSRIASQNGIKVLLNGGGADESLAGYHSFFPNYWYHLVQNNLFADAWREISAYAMAHGGTPWRLCLEPLYYGFRSNLNNVVPGFEGFARWFRKRRLGRDSWFSYDLLKSFRIHEQEYKEPTLGAALQRSVEDSPLPLYLRFEDRNSMAHSIEERMPFLDHRLVSFAFQLQAEFKMRGPWNKYILRQAMRGRIPESVRGRIDKMGFPVSTKKWFAGCLYAPIQDMLSSHEVRERGIYNMDVIRQDLELHREGKTDISGKLFNLVQFELWSKLQNSYFLKN
jgi:asparagine synthase (glutamine-hydrolysing)